MTAAEFKAKFPEFATAPDSRVEEVLADAELETADSWDARRDRVVALRAAAALALSPAGRNARLFAAAGSSSKGDLTFTSTYQVELDRLIQAHAIARSRCL
jgi:hypothetical protein